MFLIILLFIMLLCLVFNVVLICIILMEGYIGVVVVGKVVEVFGYFFVGGNFVIGIVVFVIFVIINFMVIIKGVGCIVEVGVCFVFDGMLGK